MAWFILIFAGLSEVALTTCLNKAQSTNNDIKYLWWGGFVTTLIMSMYLLYKATQTLPMGIAYAVWTGIGAVGTVLVGILYFKENFNFWQIFFILLLIFSIAGLKFVSNN